MFAGLERTEFGGQQQATIQCGSFQKRAREAARCSALTPSWAQQRRRRWRRGGPCRVGVHLSWRVVLPHLYRPGVSHSGTQRWPAECPSPRPTAGAAEAGHRASHRRWNREKSHGRVRKLACQPNLSRRCGSVSSVRASAKWTYYTPLGRRAVGLVSKQAPPASLLQRGHSASPRHRAATRRLRGLVLICSDYRIPIGAGAVRRALVLPRA